MLSLGAAAQISGLSLSEFIEHLTQLDIDLVVADQQTAKELVDKTTGTGETVWAINPDALLISSEAVRLCCDHCHHSHSGAACEIEVWSNLHCLQKSCLGHYPIDKDHTESLDF